MSLKFAFCFLVVFVSSVFGQEKIKLYDIDILVKENGDLLITEKITVHAEGNAIKRGIYRSFPTRYYDRFKNYYIVDFEVLNVQRNGISEPYFLEKKRNGVDWYIGHEDTFLPTGVYSYTLQFKTNWQLGYFTTHDELYFNAIGGDWSFDIDSVSVRVEMPAGAQIFDFGAFTGYKGATECQCKSSTKNGHILYIHTTEKLNPGEQLTFYAQIPKGFIIEPSSAEKRLRFLKNNRHFVLAFIGFIAIFLLYLRQWRRFGVDPKKGTIIPLFDPPVGYTAEELSFIHNLGMSNRILTSVLVQLAIKGVLRIEQGRSIVGRKYELLRLIEKPTSLSPYEHAVFNALLSNKSRLPMENQHHTMFASANSKLQALLERKFKPQYFSLNFRKIGGVVLLSLVLAGITFMISPSLIFSIGFGLLLLLLFIIFSYLIKAPTPHGRSIMDDIEGFIMYVRTAESRQLNAAHEPNMTIERYEALLPFALSLGIENDWGKKFERALASSLREATSGNYNPKWFSGGRIGSFSASRFSSEIGRSMSGAISSASRPPGSSSGGGGGGFSGGGGGGGGGGGW